MEGDVEFCGETKRSLLKILSFFCGSDPNKKFFTWIESANKYKSWTYLSFFQSLSQCVNFLTQIGIKKNSKVYVHLENSPEFILVLFACHYLGAVPVLVHIGWKRKQLLEAMRQVPPDFVICQDWLSELYNTNEYLKSFHRLDVDSMGRISVNDMSINLRKKFTIRKSLEAFVSSISSISNPNAIIMFTSGTTKGLPKAVCWDHNSIFYSARRSANAFRLSRDDTSFISMPLYHTLALSYQLFTSIISGGGFVIEKNFKGEFFWKNSIALQCTWTAMLGHSFDEIKRQPIPQHHYKFWITGAVYPWLEEKYQVKSIGLWGMTEIVGPAIISDYCMLEPLGCMGSLCDGFQVKLLDEYGAESNTGALHIRCTDYKIKLGNYLEFPESGIFDQWFNTGDIVHKDELDRYFFRGRISGRLRVGDENVSAYEIESVVWKSNCVKNVVVIGKKDSDLGEVPIIFAIPIPEKIAIAKSEILKICKQELAPYQFPHDVIFMESFEYTTLGKVSLPPLVEYLNSDIYNKCDGYGKKHLDIILSLWKKFLFLDDISITDNFFTLGGTSITMLKIRSEFYRLSGREISSENFIRCGSIEKIVAFLEGLEYGSNPNKKEIIL